MPTKNSGYISREEFDEKLFKIDHKFENLTDIMLGEFDKVYERFDKVDKKFDEMTETFLGEFDKVYARFDAVDKRFDTIEDKLGLIISHLGIKEVTVRS